MPAFQTTYTEGMQRGIVGQIIQSTPPPVIDSLQVEGDAGIQFGVAVTKGSDPAARSGANPRSDGSIVYNYSDYGTVRQTAVATAAANAEATNFRGVTVLDKTPATPTHASAAGSERYPKGDIASVMTQGDVLVRVAAAVKPGYRAIVNLDADHATVPVGGFVGGNTAPSAANETAYLPGARFLTHTPAGGLATLRLTGEIR